MKTHAYRIRPVVLGHRFRKSSFQVFTLIRCVYVFICVHVQLRLQINAFSVNMLSVFECISVDGGPNRIEMCAFSNENAPEWTRPECGHLKTEIFGNDDLSRIDCHRILKY